MKSGVSKKNERCGVRLEFISSMKVMEAKTTEHTQVIICREMPKKAIVRSAIGNGGSSNYIE